MAESVPVEIQMRGRVKRGRYRKIASANIQVNTDKPLSEALRTALGEVADGMRDPDEMPSTDKAPRTARIRVWPSGLTVRVIEIPTTKE